MLVNEESTIPAEVQDWDALSETERRLFREKYPEVFGND